MYKLEDEVPVPRLLLEGRGKARYDRRAEGINERELDHLTARPYHIINGLSARVKLLQRLDDILVKYRALLAQLQIMRAFYKQRAAKLLLQRRYGIAQAGLRDIQLSRRFSIVKSSCKFREIDQMLKIDTPSPALRFNYLYNTMLIAYRCQIKI